MIVVEDLTVEGLKIVGRSMGWWHRYYAEAAVRRGVATCLVLVDDGRAVGTAIVYIVDAVLRVGVIYYVAVDPSKRGCGYGKILLASAEEVLEERGCRVFVATTTEDNDAALRLFRSMGYEAIHLDELGRICPECLDNVLRATCGYEDDVLLYKGCSLRELLKVFRRCRACRDVWYEICYLPWVEMRRL